MKNFKKHTSKLGGLTLLCAAAFFTCQKVPDYCGKGELYEPDCQFCFGGKKHDLCGGGEYNPLAQDCDTVQDAVVTRCLGGYAVPSGDLCGGYTLTVAVIPDSGGHVTQRFPGWANIPAGQRIILNAAPENGYKFVCWAGAEASEDSAVTIIIGGMNADKPLVAVFKPVDTLGAANRKLITAAFPENGGTVARRPDAETYNNGAEVTVTAKPRPGYRFGGWAGAGTSKDTAVTLTMDESKTLVALFTPVAYTLAVSANPTDGGAVFVNGTAAAGIIAQDNGAAVEVRAVAAKGYDFIGWSGVAAVKNPDTVRMTNDGMTLTANFRRNNGGVPPPSFTVKVSAGIGATGGGNYVKGDTVIISAGMAPEEGLQFKNWIGNVLFTNANIARTTFAMPAKAVTVTAYFVSSNIKLGTFTDARDGRTYGTAEIGGKTWMSENLNVRLGNSWCYDDQDSNCVKYGRLYDWETAKAACPTGWSLPDTTDWNYLTTVAGGKEAAGKNLKAKFGWNNNGNGTDELGFSALPGGSRPNGSFADDAGSHGYWWSAANTEVESRAYNLGMFYDGDYALMNGYIKSNGYSVRCVQDQNSEGGKE